MLGFKKYGLVISTLKINVVFSAGIISTILKQRRTRMRRIGSLVFGIALFLLGYVFGQDVRIQPAQAGAAVTWQKSGYCQFFGPDGQVTICPEGSGVFKVTSNVTQTVTFSGVTYRCLGRTAQPGTQCFENPQGWGVTVLATKAGGYFTPPGPNGECQFGQIDTKNVWQTWQVECPIATPTQTATATVTNTPINTVTKTATPTSTTAPATETPTEIPSATPTPTSSATITAIPTETVTGTPPATETRTATATPTQITIATATQTFTKTPTPLVTESPTPKPTNSPTPELPTATSTIVPPTETPPPTATVIPPTPAIELPKELPASGTGTPLGGISFPLGIAGLFLTSLGLGLRKWMHFET